MRFFVSNYFDSIGQYKKSDVADKFFIRIAAEALRLSDEQRNNLVEVIYSLVQKGERGLRDLFEFMGINSETTLDEIRKKVRFFRGQSHPDLNPRNQRSVAAFKIMTHILEELINNNDPEIEWTLYIPSAKKGQESVIDCLSKKDLVNVFLGYRRLTQEEKSHISKCPICINKASQASNYAKNVNLQSIKYSNFKHFSNDDINEIARYGVNSFLNNILDNKLRDQLYQHTISCEFCENRIKRKKIINKLRIFKND